MLPRNFPVVDKTQDLFCLYCGWNTHIRSSVTSSKVKHNKCGKDKFFNENGYCRIHMMIEWIWFYIQPVCAILRANLEPAQTYLWGGTLIFIVFSFGGGYHNGGDKVPADPVEYPPRPSSQSSPNTEGSASADAGSWQDVYGAVFSIIPRSMLRQSKQSSNAGVCIRCSNGANIIYLRTVASEHPSLRAAATISLSCSLTTLTTCARMRS